MPRLRSMMGPAEGWGPNSPYCRKMFGQMCKNCVAILIKLTIQSGARRGVVGLCSNVSYGKHGRVIGAYLLQNSKGMSHVGIGWLSLKFLWFSQSMVRRLLCYILQK
jgi:hypothetical protein